jgi:Ca2+-binding EF-hand superfamily protein
MRHGKRANFQEFLYLVADFRKISQRALRQAEGFTPTEVEEMRAQFQEFDQDGDETVGGHELRRLIESVEPAAAIDAKARDQVASILAQIDSRDEKSITFRQFLKFMRKLQYIHETERQKKEQDIANATGFERGEVRDFHGVFTAHANEEGKISVNGFRRMLYHMVHIKNNCKLHRQLIKFVDEADQDRSGALDFPEFLIVLRRLQDTNFGNINDHSERIAASLRKPIEPSSEQKTTPNGKRANRLRKKFAAVAWISEAPAKGKNPIPMVP